MKTAMPDIVGNVGLRNRLCKDILNQKMAHAYIVAGAAGSGKHLVTTQSAAAVACERKHDTAAPIPCGECPSCRKILSGKCPDVITVSKDGKSVKIDQIRALGKDVRTLPNDLEDKFYIIEDADTLTPQAQNAFLLTLEEPPSFVHFFLLCEHPEKLLETVRSRAPILRTEMISNEDIKSFVRKKQTPASALLETKPQEFEEMLSIANGSIGKVLALSDEKERAPLLARRARASALIEHALKKDRAALAVLLCQLPTKQEELLPIFTCAQSALRDLVALKQAPDASLVFYSDRDAASELAYSCSLYSLYRVYDAIETTVGNVSRNASIRLSVSCLLTQI